MDIADLILQLKEEYHMVVLIKASSGFPWDDTVGVGKDKTDPEWIAFTKVCIYLLSWTQIILIRLQHSNMARLHRISQARVSRFFNR